MDFFHTRTDSTVTPATASYLAIYDPSLSHTEDDTINQLLLFLDKKGNTSENDKLRKIGLVDGIKQFTTQYDGDDLDVIELDDSQVISMCFEERFHFILALQLTKIEDENVIEHQIDDCFYKVIRRVLKEGYDEFRIHNGTFLSLFDSMEKLEFMELLDRWWNVWFSNFEIQLNEDGFLKLFEGLKKSELRIDSEIKYTIDSFKPDINFKELLIFNNDETIIENRGLVYEYNKSLTSDSRIRLLKWLHTVDYYGLTTSNLISSNVIKTKHEEQETTSEYIYDPFKLVYSTITDVSKASGITSGLSSVNSYMPWYKPSTTVEQEAHHEETQKTEFLIGLDDETINYKNLYLKFENQEENLHRLVIYRYFKFLIVLIYDFKQNEVNDKSYYTLLNKELGTKLGKEHLDHLMENLTATSKSFYYVGYDRSKKVIETNIPNIPLEEEDDSKVSDHQYFNDLSRSSTQSKIIHKQIIRNYSFINDNVEKLTRSKNNWWIYNLNKDHKEVYIIKKLKSSPHHDKVFENSTNIIDVIGKDGKKWLDSYIS